MTIDKIRIEQTKRWIKNCDDAQLREIVATLFEYFSIYEENTEKNSRNHETLVRNLVKEGIFAGYEEIGEDGIVRTKMTFLDQFRKRRKK